MAVRDTRRPVWLKWASLFLLIPGLASAEVHMTILKGSKVVGYATISQWESSGVKTVEMRMELGTDSRSPARLHKISTYDAQGHPIRMVLDVSGSSRSTTIATFDREGAHISKLSGDATKTRTVSRAPDAPWDDASEYWFFRDQPKAGAHVRTLLFSIDAQDWVLTDLTYLGPKMVTVAGKPVSANAILYEADGKSTTAYVDLHGEPIRLELDGGIAMEQIPAKRTGRG